MKLLGRWRAWWNRRDWPERGTFVISTEMDPEFNPPSNDMRKQRP
jgi:hypothetical protein